MPLLSLRQDHFSNQIKVLGNNFLFLYLKSCGIFTQIQQKAPSQTSAVARFRDTYAPTSRKYASNKPQTRSFQ